MIFGQFNTVCLNALLGAWWHPAANFLITLLSISVTSSKSSRGSYHLRWWCWNRIVFCGSCSAQVVSPQKESWSNLSSNYDLKQSFVFMEILQSNVLFCFFLRNILPWQRMSFLKSQRSSWWSGSEGDWWLLFPQHVMAYLRQLENAKTSTWLRFTAIPKKSPLCIFGSLSFISCSRWILGPQKPACLVSGVTS